MRAYQSSLKLFVFGIIGIVLIAAAADIMFAHWISTPPDSIDGSLTTRGHAQQRGDLLWGGAMLVAGVLLFGGSITDLIKRKPTVIVSAEGLVVEAGGSGTFLPWESVESVSSGVIPDPYDGSMREQLIVEMQSDPPPGEDGDDIEHTGDTVYIDAHDWTGRVTEVALSAQGAHDHFRRLEAIRSYEAPSMVWEITTDQSDEEPTLATEPSDQLSEEEKE
jgi:hypothetical protein